MYFYIFCSQRVELAFDPSYPDLTVTLLTTVSWKQAAFGGILRQELKLTAALIISTASVFGLVYSYLLLHPLAWKWAWPECPEGLSRKSQVCEVSFEQLQEVSRHNLQREPEPGVACKGKMLGCKYLGFLGEGGEQFLVQVLQGPVCATPSPICPSLTRRNCLGKKSVAAWLW